MKQHESGELNWFTSSYSNGEGSCVEVALTEQGAYVRDTKDRKAGTHAFAGAGWATFVQSVKAGTIGS